jgi:hypothetical protein
MGRIVYLNNKGHEAIAFPDTLEEEKLEKDKAKYSNNGVEMSAKEAVAYAENAVKEAAAKGYPMFNAETQEQVREISEHYIIRPVQGG